MTPPESSSPSDVRVFNTLTRARSPVSYEARVVRWTRAYRQVGVCLYDMDLFGGDVIVAMIMSNPKVWIEGVIVENPYFVEPYTAATTGSHGRS
jgi:hypothetical protein